MDSSAAKALMKEASKGSSPGKQATEIALQAWRRHVDNGRIAVLLVWAASAFEAAKDDRAAQAELMQINKDYQASEAEEDLTDHTSTER